MKRKLISILLSIVMVLSSAATMTVFAAEGNSTTKEKKNYAFIGDSLTFNFASGRHNFTTNLKKIYAEHIADKFGYNLLNNKEPEGSALTIGGMRTTELYTLLSDDFDGDNYTKIMFDLNSTRKAEAIDYIKKADVITMQLGTSSIGEYTVRNILAKYGILKDMAYGENPSEFYSSEDVAATAPYAKKTVDKMLNIPMLSLISSNIDLGVIRNTLEYSLISHIIDFDRSIKKIKEINPDVEIYVIGGVNTAPETRITIIGKTIYELVNPLYDCINEYMEKHSKYLDCYHYIKPVASMETYRDLMIKDKNVTKEIIELQTGNKAEAEKYYRAFMKALETKEIDVLKLINTLEDEDLELLKTLDFENYPELLRTVEKWLVLDKKGNLQGRYVEQIFAYVGATYIPLNVSVHPTQNGHKKEAEHIIAEIMATRNPNKTTMARLSYSRNAIIAKWNKKSNVDGYQIQCSTSSKFVSPKIVSVAGTKKTSGKIKGLKSGKKYYVRVRTYKTIDGVKNFSKWSKSKAINVK